VICFGIRAVCAASADRNTGGHILVHEQLMPIICRLGDISETTTPDAHGCPACPHPCKGPAVTASGNVWVQGQQALRLGDTGVHSTCCGPNTWEVVEASAQVFVNGQRLVRVGDRTRHCGAMGKLITGASKVQDGSPAQMDVPKKPDQEEAGLCVGTEDECNEQKQKAADAMTDEEAMKKLDGAFLHDPRALTPAQVKGLEALSRQPGLSEATRGKIDSFLQDYRNGVDSLGLDGQLGRPDAPPRIFSTGDA